MMTLPAGIFTASVLFDVLSLIAESPNQAHSYRRGAADLLRVGVGTALASTAIEVTDYLRAPAGGASPGATRKFAVNGSVIAVYLLDLAAREKGVGEDWAGWRGLQVMPLGLSLLGLAFLAVSGRLE